MPALRKKSPTSQSGQTRTERISRKIPFAKPIITGIQECRGPFKFGDAKSKIKNIYHFPSVSSADEFFRHYLSVHRVEEIDEDEVRSNVELSWNVRSVNIVEHTPDLVEDIFRTIANSLCDSLQNWSNRAHPFVRIIVGPTGSGKTAFSKGLITLCVNNFWSKGIVPTRVEFSKFDDGELEIDDSRLLSFIRHCQLRDLLIWCAYSGEVYKDTVERALDDCVKVHAEKILLVREYLKHLPGFDSGGAENPKRRTFDGEIFTLSDVNDELRPVLEALDPDDTKELLDNLNLNLKPKFLISFDGFDVLALPDQIIQGAKKGPVDYLTSLLGKRIKRVHGSRLQTIYFDCHYLLYVRDTTYERIRRQLATGPSRSKFPRNNWIVPPSYRSLVESAAFVASGASNKEENLSDILYRDAISCFRRSVHEEYFEDLRKIPIHAVLGYNARSIKDHISRLTLWSLERNLRLFEDKFIKRRAGISRFLLWKEIIQSKAIKEMPNYHVVEELFLDERRQLTPHLGVDSIVATNSLANGNLIEAIESIEDLKEDVGSFDSIFNYELKINITESSDYGCLAALLVKVRIIQFIKFNKGCSFTEVELFLHRCGYGLSEVQLEFFLYVLSRNEFLFWHGAPGRWSIRQVSLFISSKGDVVLERMIYSVSYFSEALLSAELPVTGLSEHLIGRDRGLDVAEWVVDCAINAIIGANIVRRVEEYEKKVLGDEAKHYDWMFISTHIEKRLGAEVASILNSNQNRMKKRWGEKAHVLMNVKSRNKDFTIIGNWK